MAKPKASEATENTEAEGGEGAAEEAKTDERYIMIKDPESGEDVKRVDWIRAQYGTEGGEFYGDRGAIAKKLTELQGKKVPYQIVFAATKDMKDVKTKRETDAEAAAAAEAKAAEEKAKEDAKAK